MAFALSLSPAKMQPHRFESQKSGTNARTQPSRWAEPLQPNLAVRTRHRVPGQRRRAKRHPLLVLCRRRYAEAGQASVLAGRLSIANQKCW